MNIDYKHADYEGIKYMALKTMEYVRNNDRRAPYAMKEFLRKGSQAPGFALAAKRNAFKVNENIFMNKVESGEMKLRSAMHKHNVVLDKFDVLKISTQPEYEIFYQNIYKLYPKTQALRDSIESSVIEEFGELNYNYENNRFEKKLICNVYYCMDKCSSLWNKLLNNIQKFLIK